MAVYGGEDKIAISGLILNQQVCSEMQKGFENAVVIGRRVTFMSGHFV